MALSNHSSGSQSALPLRYAQRYSTPELHPTRLMDQVRHILRLKHYSDATERSYVYWILTYIRFHKLRHPRELNSLDVQSFLTFLAVKQEVAAST